MEIIENRGLRFRTDNPDLIQQHVKKSAVLEDGSMLVHWNAEAVQTLRSLGIEAPSPIVRDYAYPGRDKPMEHQYRMAEFMSAHKRCFNFSDMGCVDSSTEYLSPTGWKRMDQYDGGKVAQFNLDGTAEFVQPKEYVKLPCDTMIRFKTKYGIDQLLSPEHRVLYKNHNREFKVAQACDVYAAHKANKMGWRGKIPTVFKMETGSSLPLSEAEVRLTVAVVADGHFPYAGAKCTIRLKKDRKKRRLRWLLETAGVEYAEKEVTEGTAAGYSVFRFRAPIEKKVFDEYFWGASREQLRVVASEVKYWDGTIRASGGISFSTFSRESADFVQYAFSSTGGSARMTENVRERRGRIEREYVVTVRSYTTTTDIGVAGCDNDGNKTDTVWTEPSTDGFKYCFMVPSTFLVFRRNGCVFVSGNTGKTRGCVWAADYLIEVGLVKRVLIVAPLSILESAWYEDIVATALHRSVGIAVGDPKRRDKIIHSGVEFIIINHDGVKSSLASLKKAKFDLIIVDEATAFSNVKTDRWKALNTLMKDDPYLWMLTGTPAANSPLQAFGLGKLVSPERMPKFHTAWRDMTMIKITQFKWIPRPNWKQIVFNALQPVIRFDKKDCLDLPPVTTVSREFPMDPAQKKYYDLMKRDRLMNAAGEDISAVNSGVLMGKLLQLAAGAVYSDDGEIVDFKASTRMQEMVDVINESSEKVLVFAQYRHNIALIAKHLHACGISCEVIQGDTNKNERPRIISNFQQNDDVKVLVLQPRVAAHGITLTRANVAIWFSPTSNLEHWRQANDRINRMGQQNPMTIVKLIGAPIERRVYAVLEDRDADQSSLLSLYREEISE